MNTIQTECPVCGCNLSLGKNVIVSELVDCVDCGIELEVVGINPIQLNEAPQEEEDWGE